jgi:hypothetical protein
MARTSVACLALLLAAQIAASKPAAAEDRLLNEVVNFTGTLTWLATKVPGFILVAARNGEFAFAGFGAINDSGGLQGNFAYLGIAPTRGVAAFFAMNAFSLAGFPAAVTATNDLIAELAPR